jgi:conserved oligomeric Golgi complex subunit 6
MATRSYDLPSDEDLTTPKQKSTALTTKISTLLSTTYTSELRDTLHLLDSRNLVNNESTRRNLKPQAEREVIDINAAIIDDFGILAAQLSRVGVLVKQLNSTCDMIRKNILAAKREAAPVLEEANVLLERKKDTETKEKVLKAFTTHFVLSDEELNTLTNSGESVDERFFGVLGRTKQISKDCEVLLAYNTDVSSEGEGDGPRLGNEILSQTTIHLDQAYRKLYTWVTSHFKTSLDIEDPHVTASIRRALRVLSERPSMFQACLDSFAESRAKSLGQAFQDALVGNKQREGGSGKAIEFNTHEPLRYVGDMLAWVHGSAVSEREGLEGLFVGDEEGIREGLKDGGRFDVEPWGLSRRRQDLDDDEGGAVGEQDVFDGKKALSHLISRNLAVVCQTLQSRIDVTVRTANSPVLVYKIYNLLDFYHGIFAKLLEESSDTSLAGIISTLRSSTLAHFEEAVGQERDANIAAVGDHADDSSNLTPPIYYTTALSRFSEICRIRGSSLTVSELEKLVITILGEATAMSVRVAEQIQDPLRRAIFEINLQCAVRDSLISLEGNVPSFVAGGQLTSFNERIQHGRDKMVELMDKTFMEYSGIADLKSAVEAQSQRSDQSTNDERSFESKLDEAAPKLDEFLGSAVMDAEEALKQVVDRAMAKEVVAEAVERFCDEFDELEGTLDELDARLHKPDESDEDRTSLRDLYPRTGAEVRALLS